MCTTPGPSMTYPQPHGFQPRTSHPYGLQKSFCLFVYGLDVYNYSVYSFLELSNEWGVQTIFNFVWKRTSSLFPDLAYDAFRANPDRNFLPPRFQRWLAGEGSMWTRRDYQDKKVYPFVPWYVFLLSFTIGFILSLYFMTGFRTSHGFATTRSENSFIDDGKFPHSNLSQMNCLPHRASTKPESNPASSIHRTSIASSEDRSHIVSDKGFFRCWNCRQ